MVPRKPDRAHLGDKYRYTHRQRDRNDKRQNGRDDGAIDERQGAELIVYRVPLTVKEEFHAKGMPGEMRISY